MRRIEIKIDAGYTTCKNLGKSDAVCPHFSKYPAFCDVFKTRIDTDSSGYHKRLPQCLAADKGELK